MRPRPWLRVMLSLVTAGLMLGLMLGRLLAPVPTAPHLLGAEAQGEALLLRFDQPAPVRAGQLEGALAIVVDANGETREGQFRLAGQPLRWRVEPRGSSLWITLLSTRPLQGEWDSTEEQGEWRLRILAKPR
ncbi:hypothetical protein [Pseudomonas panipatensis]|uniref:hypothetical protein n=1 Tax=Pseudomonas panipatensis TaxID=428992 RepID=UPI0035ADC954